MRQLITTEFKDATSYSQLASGDVGAIVIDHFTGPVDSLQTLDFAQFQALYPPTRGVALTPSYVNAYRAYQTGLGTLEVICLKGTKTYFAVKVSEGAAAGSRVQNLNDTESALIIAFKYPGNPDILLSQGSTYAIEIEVTTEDTAIKDVPDVVVSLIRKYTDNLGEEAQEVVESFTGGFSEGCVIEGENYDIQQLINGSQYLQCIANYSKELTAFTQSVDATIETITKIAVEDLVNAYNTYFRDIEQSVCTIIIDPGVEDFSQAQTLLQLSEYRQNCTTLIGYPTTNEFTEEAIKTFQQSIKVTMFGAFYAIREQATIAGRNYLSNGIGSLAGTYAFVAQQESVNQLPSAKTWGSFAVVLAQALTADQVLALQEEGINSVYNSVDGPRLWGLRSLYSRSTSYFSKFNVARTTARILQYAFNVAMDVIHTGNTPQRRALVQNNLNTDLDRLKAQGALRMESSVRCDDTNNYDSVTNGGEYLIIDYECWYIKLIERVLIRITATDSSVSATVTQG